MLVTFACAPHLDSHLDESGCGEVTFEGERLGYPSPSHQRKAGRIDERVVTFVVTPQPLQCFDLDRLLDTANPEPRGATSQIEERDRWSVAHSPSQEGPGLADHMVARYQAWTTLSPNADSLLVIVVATELKRYPKRGIDEPHRAGP